MDIVARVQAILMKPREEWLKIKAEPATAAGLFTSYIMILAAIPPAFQFLGNVLVGKRLPLVGVYRWPIGRALGFAIASYIVSLVTVYVFALIIDQLAPSFSSAKNMTAALKLAAYSMTPGWIAGILFFIPGLWALGLVASLYGLYLLYLGFAAPMMETPKDKVPGYMAVSVVVVLALAVVFNWIVKGIFAVRYGRL
ncbi:MAG TPA: Yip1 family protein [Candidatus Aminicenantes bacterium]|nr:Yip1 family protein [Candidatus Aminicenantes bacterium]HRY63771.1 Yip1 family protein [Candidatus Aminicenantes bacterium]HRZ70684.1 Yip1 family protein [Candidatus Aminicenantes bacterium]